MHCEVELPRKDLDKKGPLCKLIHNSRESEWETERESTSPVSSTEEAGGARWRSDAEQRWPRSRAEMARGKAHARRSGWHLGGVGQVVEEHRARNGPGVLQISYSRSGLGISTGVAGDGDRPSDWSREPGGECWSLGWWRQTGEPVGVADQGWVGGGRGLRVGRRLRGQGGERGSFFGNALRELLFEESSHPCIRRGPQTRGDETPE
jgi:hypothetical protein